MKIDKQIGWYSDGTTYTSTTPAMLSRILDENGIRTRRQLKRFYNTILTNPDNRPRGIGYKAMSIIKSILETNQNK